MRNRISRAFWRISRSCGLSNHRRLPEQKTHSFGVVPSLADLSPSLQSNFFSQLLPGTIRALGGFARETLRDCFRKNSTLNSMAIRTSRLTHIDARRLNGVAGCEPYSAVVRGNYSRARRRWCADLTEVSRAIHGYNREPPCLGGDDRPRVAQYSFLLRLDCTQRTELRRPVRRRQSHSEHQRDPYPRYDFRRRYH